MAITSSRLEPRDDGYSYLRLQQDGDWRDATEQETGEWARHLAEKKPMSEFYAKLNERAGQ